ncbi:helix-turn-helix transcriptional regulator [Novosphingobium sp. FKTRR1]|uniref:helix-turn-helix domain-containing protein n=1 Tax=Novosphingobium sp. FKTRR1 TaxID=2879118 RepID=UPI001CF0B018|nr:helix-turn-helix transcriptional regulator [Novosphingobium sp. FKTRR1]
MDPRRYRKSRNMRLQEVADLIGVRSKSTVSKHERGHIFPSPELIDAYRRYSGGKIQFEDFEELRRRAGAEATIPISAQDHANVPT